MQPDPRTNPEAYIKAINYTETLSRYLALYTLAAINGLKLNDICWPAFWSPWKQAYAEERQKDGYYEAPTHISVKRSSITPAIEDHLRALGFEESPGWFSYEVQKDRPYLRDYYETASPTAQLDMLEGFYRSGAHLSADAVHQLVNAGRWTERQARGYLGDRLFENPSLED